MNKQGATLKVEGLSKRWGRTKVLADISFEIESGTFITLLGPSGCGKSTALRLIAGLDSVSDGRILVDGKDVTTLPPSERNIGMVFQNYALFPHMTVQQNILYGLRVRRTPIEEQKRSLERVTELMGFSELLQRHPAQLSGGQQQRVALARVLVAQRSLVLMDEPLSNLDAKLRVEIRSEIRELNKRLGITIVYVTHDQSEALSMSDKVLLMNGGTKVQFGTPTEIYSQPRNTFAAGFIGTPPMNLLAAHLLEQYVKLPPSSISGEFQVGIRPEDLTISNRPTASGLRGKIIASEYEGVHSLVTVDVAGQARAVAIVPKGQEIELGTDVFLDVEPKSMHLFALSDGQRVSFEPELDVSIR